MTAACDAPCVNNRAASNRRASNAAMRRRPRGGVVMPQHRMVLHEIHHFISRDSLVPAPHAIDRAVPELYGRGDVLTISHYVGEPDGVTFFDFERMRHVAGNLQRRPIMQ